ncbi:hypothetical protein GQ43DRAFT_273684 [Delitschia confertaspora ATCC 74209]|uniref:Uncharacterized protein n=1 Tax=Delitschia confertaspora ATCC 74209 TaxID=1513339 RepID=A0A9P4MQN5_9PLEO|nr:hypothetical protein GQ43DRAFT_273684 [Delitschia confertaspora ATCC 74209]
MPPRVFPWEKNKKTTTKAQAKSTTNSTATSKRKWSPAFSDDDLPTSPPLASVGASKQTAGSGKKRHLGLSSSPVPELDLTGDPPITYPMRTAPSKHELRDDQWMMVEDELLATAKLYTRHLHLKEYKRIQQELRNKSNKKIFRPVVGDAKASAELKLRMRADAQRKKQKKHPRTIREISDNEEEQTITLDPPIGPMCKSQIKQLSPRALIKMTSHPLVIGRPTKITTTIEVTDEEYDSEDLDAPVRAASKRVTESAALQTAQSKVEELLRNTTHPLVAGPRRAATEKPKPAIASAFAIEGKNALEGNNAPPWPHPGATTADYELEPVVLKPTISKARKPESAKSRAARLASRSKFTGFDDYIPRQKASSEMPASTNPRETETETDQAVSPPLAPFRIYDDGKGKSTVPPTATTVAGKSRFIRSKPKSAFKGFDASSSSDEAASITFRPSKAAALIAKRKAQREKEAAEEEKNKPQKLTGDELPTFLV